VGFPNISGSDLHGADDHALPVDYGLAFYSTGIATINPPVITPPYPNNPATGPIYRAYVPRPTSERNDIAGVRLVRRDRAARHLHRLGAACARRRTTAARASGQFNPFPRTEADPPPPANPPPLGRKRYPTFAATHAKIRDALTTWWRTGCCCAGHGERGSAA